MSSVRSRNTPQRVARRVGTHLGDDPPASASGGMTGPPQPVAACTPTTPHRTWTFPADHPPQPPPLPFARKRPKKKPLSRDLRIGPRVCKPEFWEWGYTLQALVPESRKNTHGGKNRDLRKKKRGRGNVPRTVRKENAERWTERSGNPDRRKPQRHQERDHMNQHRHPHPSEPH